MLNRVALLPLLFLAAACVDRGPMKLSESDAAPNFSLPSAQGDRVSLADYRGEREVLLYFSMGPG